LFGIEAAADAVKVPRMVFAGIVTDTGTVKAGLLLLSSTTTLLDAVWLSVTVQVAAPLAFTLVGLQTKPEMVTADKRFTVAVCEVPPSVAVTVTP
jgi:hypothetical protein